MAALSGRVFARDVREATREMEEFLKTVAGYRVLPETPFDAPSRRWSIRSLIAVATQADFESFMARLSPLLEQKPLNLELKLFARPRRR